MNSFEHILQTVLNNPLYLVFIVALAILIAWSLIKKLFKFAIIFAICSIAYVVYIYIENPKETKQKTDEIFKKGSELVEEGFKKGSEILETEGKKIIDKGKEIINNP